jgi:Tfp pilus assembly major pilin PilA
MGTGASVAIGAAGSIAGKLADGWAAKQKALTDQHGMDVTAATQITVEGFKTDMRFAELQATQNLADRQDKRTSWIRPAYAAPAWFYWFCVVLQATLPGVAKFIGITMSPLPFPFDYLAFGIPLAIFGLRPVEKYSKASTVTKAQATISQASK